MKIILTENQYRLITEGLVINDNNRLNRDPSGKPVLNTIYLDEDPIVDLSIGRVGDFEDPDGFKVNNGLEIVQMSSASTKMGYGRMSIEFLFNKLPKIQNIYVQCYGGACGFWKKIGGNIVKRRETPFGDESTVIINRNDFFS